MSSATVRSTTEVHAAGERLTATELLGWLQALPTEVLTDPSLILQEITRQTGHQRDPVSVLAGMRATWEAPL